MVEPVLESECASCAVADPSAAAVAPIDRPYLRLVSHERAAAAVDAPAESAAVASTWTRSSGDDAVSPPLAEPVEAVASALWASPTEVLGLLAAASEHRRVVDLIWNASQIGALQLPPSLIAAVERARASWPQALPISC